MLYFRLNAALEVLEIADKAPAEGPWSRNVDGVLGEGWASRWDWHFSKEPEASRLVASGLALSASKLAGVRYSVQDSGPGCSPRFDVVRDPEPGKDGLYANQLGYSDVYPFEVVRVVSAQCVEVRELEAVLDPSFQPEIIPGGFAGHCVNQDRQRWIYSSNPANRVVRIRKGVKGWKSAQGNRFVIALEPRKFHDYNF